MDSLRRKFSKKKISVKIHFFLKNFSEKKIFRTKKNFFSEFFDFFVKKTKNSGKNRKMTKIPIFGPWGPQGGYFSRFWRFLAPRPLSCRGA